MRPGGWPDRWDFAFRGALGPFHLTDSIVRVRGARKSECQLFLLHFLPACHAGGRGFEPRLSRHHFNGLGVASEGVAHFWPEVLRNLSPVCASAGRFARCSRASATSCSDTTFTG